MLFPSTDHRKRESYLNDQKIKRLELANT